MRTILADDEKTARDILRDYLVRYCPGVDIVGEAADGREAIDMIRELRPEVVFLDIEMPYGTGFDVMEATADIGYEAIFLTAYAEYAIKALNMSASYYLLKPLDIEEMIQAVERVQESLDNRKQIDRNKVLLDNFLEKQPRRQTLVLPTMEGFELVKTGHIVRLQGNGNFTDIYLQDGRKKMVCRVLGFFENLLPAEFIRVHRSHIVNTDFITAYHKGSGGYLSMTGGADVEVSSAYKDELIRKLHEG